MIILTILLIPLVVLTLFGLVVVIGSIGTVPPPYVNQSDEAITSADNFSLTQSHTDPFIEPILESFQTQTADMTADSTPVLYF
jgi:hypothetical protein